MMKIVKLKAKGCVPFQYLSDYMYSLVPDGGPVCDMLSPKFGCFSE